MNLDVPDRALARTISEAAFNPQKWIDVCDGMNRLVSAGGGCIIPTDVAQRALGLPHSAQLDSFVSTYQSAGWYKRDLRERGLSVMYRRGFMTDADCIAYDDISKSNFYQDFLRSVGLRWFVGLCLQAEQSTWVLTLQRGVKTEPFSQREVDKVMAYRELLTNSAVIARQLGFAQTRGAASALEQQGLCAIALDAGERVVHVSPSAERHLHDGLELSGGRLRARQPDQGPALARLIRSICKNGETDSAHHVSISRPDGKPPLVLYGCSLPDAQCDVFQPAVGLLVISDPGRNRDIPLSLLMDYFGLTYAEAGLAETLVRGGSIEDHATRHGVSAVTVRNQLQSVLRKTSTHRQVELVAALHRVIPKA
jgi:DNA-binding CsgD family transcriptional regulator